MMMGHRIVYIVPAAFILFLGCPANMPPLPSPPDTYIAKPAGGFLYVLVPALNEVVRVDPVTLAKSPIAVGLSPTTMDVSADGERLIVLNARSSSVSVISARAGSVTAIPVRKGANAIAVSPTGRYAVVYLDLSQRGYVPVEGVLNLNEITLVDTVTGESVPIALGFDPSIAGFTPSEGAAVVLSRSQAAIVSTAPPYTKVTVPLVADPSQYVTPSHLVVTMNKAFVSVKESGDIYAIDLASPSVNIVTVGGVPFMVESVMGGALLLAGITGSTRVSLVDTNTLWVSVVDLGTAYDSGVVSPDETLALFFKRGEPRASLLTLPSRDVVTYSLLKGVDDAGITGNGAEALILHTPGISPTYLQYSVSVLDIAGRTVHPIALQSAPAGFTIYSPEAAFVSLEDAGGVAAIDMKEKIGSFLETPARPRFVGSMGAGQGVYVVHDKPMGRATFIAVPSLTIRSVDGIFTTGIYDR